MALLTSLVREATAGVGALRVRAEGEDEEDDEADGEEDHPQDGEHRDVLHELLHSSLFKAQGFAVNQTKEAAVAWNIDECRPHTNSFSDVGLSRGSA